MGTNEERFIVTLLLAGSLVACTPGKPDASTSPVLNQQPTLSRTGPSGVLARSYLFRSSTIAEASSLSARFAALAKLDEGLGGSFQEQLRRAGIVGAVVPVAVADDLLKDVSRPPKPGATSQTSLGTVLQTPVPSAPRWLTLQSGQSSEASWTLALAGGPTALPAGQVRLLARAWSVPGDATSQGVFTSQMMVDLVPQILTDARGQNAASSAPIRVGSQPSERGLALMGQRVTVSLKAGQVLVLAPLLTRTAPATETASEALQPGEVARTSAVSAKPAATELGPIGPGAETPLSLGEALLSDARVTEPARQAAVLILTPQMPGAYAVLP